MTVTEARSIQKEFYEKSVHTEEEYFLYTEAMKYLIEEEQNPRDMLSLGGLYYGQKNFDLALKYYEMASACGFDEADECLGYIWYYGRTGSPDYQKAYSYFSKSMESGNPVSSYKVADMYKNGYYVEKSYDKYVSIIEELYHRIKDAKYLYEPLPEIFTRLAKIRTAQGKIDEAIELYLDAKWFLQQRIQYDDFFGNLNIMQWLIQDIYSLIEFDQENFDLYDLYYLLKNPAKVVFLYNGRTQYLNSSIEEGECVIHFNNSWYRNINDFFAKASLDGQKLTAIYQELYGFVLMEEEE